MAKIQQVSFTAPTDFSVEQQNIDRQRKMAEALQQQAFQPMEQGQMVSGIYVRPSVTQGLAKLLQAYQGRKAMEAADERQKDLGQRANQSFIDGIQNYQKALEGTPAQEFKVFDDEYGQQTATSPAMPGDKNKALAALLNSNHPTLQQFGMQQMISGPGKYSTTPQYDQNGRAFVVGESGDIKYLGGITARDKAEFVNGRAVNPYQTAPGTVIPKQVDFSSDLIVPDGKGGFVPNAPLVGLKKEIASAGASKNQTTVVNAGEQAFAKELGKLDAEKLSEWRKGAEAGQSMLGIVGNLRDAVKKGVYSGGAADAKLAAANLINGITGKTPKELPGSQLFDAEASKLVLDNIKALGANPSNADRDFIQKTVPQLATSPEARDALINFMEQKALKQIRLYENADTYARRNNGLGGFSAANDGKIVDFGSLK